MIELLGGRKFFLSVLALLITTGLCYLEKIHEGVFSTIVIALIATYIGGNVTQKINTKTDVATTPK